MAKSGRLELGDNIYGHYRYIFNHCDVFRQQSNRICWKTQNKGYYAVQGHPRSSRSVPIESLYATSYQWFIVTDYQSRPDAELSQLIVQILNTLHFWPTVGGGSLGTYNVHLGFIGKHAVDFLLVIIELFSLDVTAEALRAITDRKLAISLQCGQFDPKFQVEGEVPYQ